MLFSPKDFFNLRAPMMGQILPRKECLQSNNMHSKMRNLSSLHED